MRQLSQQEIDAAFQSRQGSDARQESKAVAFDFQKSDRIPKSQLRVIHFLHENFVRTFSSSLSGYLRAYVSGSLVSVEQIPHAGFLDGLPPNTCTVSLAILPSGDNAVLEINPSLIFPALELLLGSKEISSSDPNRELTGMERHLLSGLFRLIINDLEQTWRGVEDVAFRVESTDGGRASSRAIGPTEAVVAIGMEFTIEDRVGMISLAVPAITMKTMVREFDQQGLAGEPEPDELHERSMLGKLAEAAITLEPRLDSKISVKHLLAMKIGSVVVFDHPVTRTIGCTANGKAKFEGSIVCPNDRWAWQLERVKDPDPERPVPARAAKKGRD